MLLYSWNDAAQQRPSPQTDRRSGTPTRRWTGRH